MDSEKGEKQNHTNKEHSCITCEKSFLSNSKLIIHERVHTGVKPYGCEICYKTFNQSINLDKHLN